MYVINVIIIVVVIQYRVYHQLDQVMVEAMTNRTSTKIRLHISKRNFGAKMAHTISSRRAYKQKMQLQSEERRKGLITLRRNLSLLLLYLTIENG